jgi:hypothetical protein
MAFTIIGYMFHFVVPSEFVEGQKDAGQRHDI